MNQPEMSIIKIKDVDGSCETVAAEQVSNDVYKLLESPILSCYVNYGTEIKVKPDENGELEMVEVFRASEYKTRSILLPKLSHEAFLTKIGNPIEKAGGLWELICGGMLFVHLPIDSDFDLNSFFNTLNND